MTLRERYLSEAVPVLMNEFGLHSVMQAPRVQKVVVNVGLGEALQNERVLQHASRDLAVVTGQKPIITKARRSIAGFKLRAGNEIGVKVTLRGQRMYDFLDRLINLALPRQRDFRGISPDSFDGRGNYTLGLREQLVFPEIDYDQIDRVRGMDVCIVTSAANDEQARRLLELLGLPFRES
jgi:large subunit ribosomal protein L5